MATEFDFRDPLAGISLPELEEEEEQQQEQEQKPFEFDFKNPQMPFGILGNTLLILHQLFPQI